MAVHFREELKQQWERVRTGLGGRPAIDSMTAMYRTELRELDSAEQQLCALADEIWVSVRNGPLAERLSEYAAALRTRQAELGKVLSAAGAGTRDRPDEVMHALVGKTSRMFEQSSENVRDAALVASLQRIIHYMIAEYGTIASHAQALGRMDEASQFAQHADRDREVASELSELATSTLSTEATGAAESSSKTRGH
jgi:ferritin-like metal-binding protein YciE